MRNRGFEAQGFTRWGARTAAALLMATTALASPLLTAPAQAQEQSAAIAFNIPAQELGEAVTTFGQQARIQVTAGTGLLAGKRSASVSGRFSPAEALSRLLAGTGVTYRWIDRNTVVLELAPQGAEGTVQLGPVRVEGGIAKSGSYIPPQALIGNLPPPYAGGQVATGGQLGLLGNRDVMDTPFSQTSYTSKLAQDQQARTLYDVLANDPSVVPLISRGTDFTATSFRGFTSNIDGYNSDYSLNGLFGLVPGNPPLMGAIERVEVLKGPSALLNGMPPAGATGGTVNLVTKRASDDPLTEITASYASNAQIGGLVDFGRRFGKSSEFGARFNATYRNGRTSVDTQKDEQGAATLNLDYRGQRVRLSIDIGHSTNTTNSASMPIYTGNISEVPDAPAPSSSFSPPWAYYKNKSTFGMVQGEFDLSDRLTAYLAGGVQKFDSERNTATPSLINPLGDYQFRARYTRLFSDNEAIQGGLRATFHTGPINHKLNFNASRLRQVGGFAIGRPPVLQFTNIYNPVFGLRPDIVDPGDPTKADEIILTGFGLADTLTLLNERIQFTLGVRRQRVETASFDGSTGAEIASYDASAWSPTFAVLLKPHDHVSIYGNYIEGLQQGMIVGPDYTNAGAIFPPYKSKQYEAGVKVDWGSITTTLSAFQIARPSAIDLTGSALPTLTLDGEQRNRGIEFNVFGEITPRLRVVGGATFIDARLTKTNGGVFDGNKAQGAPGRYTFSAEYDTPILQGLTLTGRITHSEEAFASNFSQTLKIPSWTRVDFGARYTTVSPWGDKPLTLRLSVENLFDASYWASGFFEYVSLGEPRTVLLSATFGF